MISSASSPAAFISPVGTRSGLSAPGQSASVPSALLHNRSHQFALPLILLVPVGMVLGSIPDRRKGFFDDLSGLLKIRDAAHSRIVWSSAPESPTSWIRAISNPGLRRNSPHITIFASQLKRKIAMSSTSAKILPGKQDFRLLTGCKFG